MNLFDVNPLSGWAALRDSRTLEKFVKAFLACGAAAFVGFWSVFGATGLSLLWDGQTPIFALLGGFFSGCIAMAGAVSATMKVTGAWKDLQIVLPKSAQVALAAAEDLANKPPETSEEEKRRLLE